MSTRPQSHKLDSEEVRYVFYYYQQLMNTTERAAHRHLTATLKLTRGRSDPTAQAQARSSSSRLRNLFSDDPKVLDLTSEGIEAFIRRTALRIFRDHGKEISFNDCPKCGRVAKTPKAKQCCYCRHDWHSP